MALTPNQLETLAADIAADPALSAIPNTADGAYEIAAAYNVAALPDFWVWRTRVSRDDYVGSTSSEGTTFNWTGNGYITRSQGERDAFRELFDAAGFANPSRPSVRQAFTDIFSGAGTAAANRTHLSTVSRRKATRGEQLYAVGTGSTADPALMVVEGNITPPDVMQARNLPAE